MSQLEDTISSAALTPAAASGDAGSVTARSLSELIAADKHLKGAAQASNPINAFRGRNIKLIPPGTV